MRVPIKEISSRDNPRYKDWQRLLQKKYRDKECKFLLEGELLLKDAEKSGAKILDLIISSRSDNPMEVAEEISCDEAFILSGDLYDSLCDTENGRFVMGVIEKPILSREDFSGNILVLDRIQDPGNMGTLIRTADAAGFSGIICIKGTVDAFSPKVVRAAAGSVIRIPILYLDEEEAIGLLREQGVKIVATGVKDSQGLWDTDLKDRIALVLGNEGEGVSQRLFDIADKIISIPMYGEIESLNVGVAGAISMYEILRQQK